MVGKKIANPDRGSSKSSRITKLCNYIAEPTRTPNYLPEHQHTHNIEKCTYLGGRGFFSESIRGRSLEMVSLAEEAVKSPDPVTHYMLSWQQGERPTPEQIEEAVSIFAKELRVSDHQMIYGLHEDTDNIHLHIAINRVHPETLKVAKIGGGFDIELVHKAIAKIEHIQGWKREKNGRYIINEKGKAVKAKKKSIENKDSPKKPGQRAIDKERETGTKSAERIAIERAAPILERAKSWQEVHEQLAKQGMKYGRYGSGAVIFVGDQPVKASVASRKASINQMQKRLGPFELMGESNVYFEHRPGKKPYPDKTRNLSEHGLRKLSECSLAPNEEIRKKRPRVLSIDARIDRRRTQPVRRHNDLPVRLTPEPLYPGDPILASYVAERELYRVKRNQATEEMRAEHRAERELMRQQQTAQRTRILEGSWMGKGTERNAVASVLAAEQAKEREELQERQKQARMRLAEIMPPFPGYEEWLRRQGMEAEAEAWRMRQQEKREAEQKKEKVNSFSGPGGNEYVPPIPPRDIRAFEAKAKDDDTVEYARKDAPDTTAFVDRGQQIDIHDTQADSTLAAMQLAQAKWGQVHVDGDDKFKADCIRLAVKNGIEISNPELQQQVEAERIRLAAEFGAPVPSHQPNPPTDQPEHRQPTPMAADDDPDWDIRAEADAQMHEPATAAQLEAERERILVEMDRLAKRDMPFNYRLEETRRLSQETTRIEAEIEAAQAREAQAEQDRQRQIQLDQVRQQIQSQQIPAGQTIQGQFGQQPEKHGDGKMYWPIKANDGKQYLIPSFAGMDTFAGKFISVINNGDKFSFSEKQQSNSLSKENIKVNEPDYGPSM
jgi:hypothetical protein